MENFPRMALLAGKNMKIHSLKIILAVVLTSCIARGESSILNKSVTLESNEHFKLHGDIQTQFTFDGEKQSEQKVQVDTKMLGFYPSPHAAKGSIAGSGQFYVCKVEVLNSDWHPMNSKTILSNIGWQIAEKTEVKLASTSNSMMNKAGKGMVHLMQSDKVTLTLILIATDDSETFHLSGTYTEAK